MEKAGFEPAFFLLYITLLLIIGPIWYNNTVMERCPSGLRSWSWKPVTPQGAVGSNPTLSATLESPLGLICTPFTGQPVKGVFLWDIVINLKEKYELVCQVLSGQGLRAVAIVAGINSG